MGLWRLDSWLISSGSLLLSVGALTSACGGRAGISPSGDGDTGEVSSGDGDGDGDGVIVGDGDTIIVGDGDGDIIIVGDGDGDLGAGGRAPLDPVCGDGVLDVGEGCDDGNLTSADGCSSSCDVEGSCFAPVKIELIDDVGSVRSSTSGGGSDTASSSCGGEVLGSGADRTFELNLTEPTGLLLTLDAEFDAILRIRETCGGASLSCDQVAAGLGSLSTDLLAGTYLVTVDGAQGSDRGDFELTASLLCPGFDVRLEEISVSRDRIVIRNEGSCAVGTRGMGLSILSGASTWNLTLPAAEIPVGEELTIVSHAAREGELALDTTFWDLSDQSSSVFLCTQACNLTTGVGILDVLHADPAHILPNGVTFSPSPLELVDHSLAPFPLDYTIYRRTGTSQAAPDFFASDWSRFYALDFDRFDFAWNRTEGVTTAEVLSDPDGRTFLRLTNPPVNGVSEDDFYVAPGLSHPSRISYSIRAKSNSRNGHCYAYFGSLGDPDRVVYSWINNFANVWSFNGQQSYQTATPVAETWYDIAYELNWVSETFDLYINSALVTSGQAMDANVDETGISNIRLGNWDASAQCDYGPIVMSYD